jgi:hypothetical protein
VCTWGQKGRGVVVALKDAREEVDEQGEEEEDDVADCEEGIVPLILQDSQRGSDAEVKEWSTIVMLLWLPRRGIVMGTVRRV